MYSYIILNVNISKGEYLLMDNFGSIHAYKELYLPITIIEIGNTKHAAMSKNTQHERPKKHHCPVYYRKPITQDVLRIY